MPGRLTKVNRSPLTWIDRSRRADADRLDLPPGRQRSFQRLNLGGDALNDICQARFGLSVDAAARNDLVPRIDQAQRDLAAAEVNADDAVHGASSD